MDGNDDNSLTVACISIVGGSALVNCIRSVLHSGFDCVVVADEDAITDEITELISDHHLEIISTDGRSVPGKRAIAVKRAKPDWIALIEDTCTISEGWRKGCEAIINCKSIQAAAGPVRLGQSLSTRARALYCSDYGKFFPSAFKHSANRDTTGIFRSETLPGANLLYHRDTVMQYIDDDGLIESEVNRRMNEDGFGLYIHKDLVVTLEHADENGISFRSRFNHGRLYGGLRSKSMTSSQRVLRAIACGLLPFVLSYRSLRSLAHDRRKIPGTALFIIAFETVWSCGECTGYLLGCGKSLEYWK